MRDGRCRSFCALHSAFCILRSSARRFYRDETGQGIIFAAASILVLVGFVAMVYNLGRVIERRTKMQLAADAAAYSGAVVQANSLSTIGWINSAMAQVYYQSLQYAVDLNVTGVAAELERRAATGNIQAAQAYQQAYDAANAGLPRAKQWMLDLSRMENAIAILTPRLAHEEMYAVASRTGAERIATYPSFRMFPHGSSAISFRVEQMPNGWRITNLAGGSNEMLYVYLEGNSWHLQYTKDGINNEEVVITKVSDIRWHIEYFGATVSQVYLEKNDQGWAVWGDAPHPPGGDAKPLPHLTFTPVDLEPHPNGDGYKEGMQVSDGSTTQTYMNGKDGNLYVWNNASHSYENWSVSTLDVGGVKVNVNATNSIRFSDYASAHIGDPTTVDIGKAHITLSDPPVIATGLGPVTISIKGFSPTDLGISVGGYSLMWGDADGRWRKWFDPINELWQRHRLTEQVPAFDALKQWQYDHEVLGAFLREETSMKRYIDSHAFGDRFPGQAVLAVAPWSAWFNRFTGMPYKAGYKPDDSDFDRVDWAPGNPRQGYYLRLKPEIFDTIQNDPQIYYLTQYNCPKCRDDKGVSRGGAWDAAQNKWIVCDACEGKDYGAPPLAGSTVAGQPDASTDVRVFVKDFVDALQRNGRDPMYAQAAVHVANSYGLPAKPGKPLVLAPEFFQYGLNVGTWQSRFEPMLFPYDKTRDDPMAPPNSTKRDVQPRWGNVAITSARVGLYDPAAGHNPPFAFTSNGRGYRYNFDAADQREQWCDTSDLNLYTGDFVARLYPVRNQMNAIDLDYGILQGQSVRATDESPTSYLWDAILNDRHYSYNQNGSWTTSYGGKTDPRVNNALRNMTNRQGQRFDFGSEGIDELVQH